MGSNKYYKASNVNEKCRTIRYIVFQAIIFLTTPKFKLQKLRLLGFSQLFVFKIMALHDYFSVANNLMVLIENTA